MMTRKTTKARQKHDELTTDDLLKLQEGYPSKKFRLSTIISDSGHSAGSDESDSTAPSSGDDSSDQEGSQEDAESISDQLNDEQFERDRLELGTIEDSGRLKLSRHTDSISTSTPRPTQIPEQLIRSFSDMGVSSALESTLHRMSIHTPTEIQAACIPPILAGANWWSETLPRYSVNVALSQGGIASDMPKRAQERLLHSQFLSFKSCLVIRMGYLPWFLLRRGM
jgi:hypothetical protein